MNVLSLTIPTLVTTSIVLNERATGATSAAEYARLYAEARREAARLSLRSRADIARVYRKAADEAAKVVEDALERGLSELTSERWASMAARLDAAADEISAAVEDSGRKLIAESGSLYATVDAEYLLAAVAAAEAGDRITRIGVRAMVSGVNRRLVESLGARLWKDGYTFSDRCWNLREDWLERIRMTVSAGIAQGRDPVKIAKDIQVYTADGKVALVQRWGKLERGTAEFAKRIPGRVDWRAARLVRSELYASLQDAAAMAGDMNPGTDGEFDWVLSVGREDWPCECAELAAGGPYRKDTIPTYPHPHCSCSVVPRLRDRKQFVSDLSRWARGDGVDYLDSWYETKYKGAA